MVQKLVILLTSLDSIAAYALQEVEGECGGKHGVPKVPWCEFAEF